MKGCNSGGRSFRACVDLLNAVSLFQSILLPSILDILFTNMLSQKLEPKIPNLQALNGGCYVQVLYPNYFERQIRITIVVNEIRSSLYHLWFFFPLTKG